MIGGMPWGVEVCQHRVCVECAMGMQVFERRTLDCRAVLNQVHVPHYHIGYVFKATREWGAFGALRVWVVGGCGERAFRV